MTAKKLRLDPIEKKPLYKFFPGSRILSVGSYGCNLNCPFCQNHEISMADSSFPTRKITPEQLAALAKELIPQKNIGVAFTYNEPFISYEFIRDTSEILHKMNLKSVLVTNGTVCSGALKKILPLIDAMNIDLKGFSQEIYDKLGGNFETVRKTIEISAQSCHIEITSLIVPTMNDSAEEMNKEAAWIAQISENIPLHISRFFPRYKITNIAPTPIKKIYELVEVAKRHLNFVYAGNC